MERAHTVGPVTGYKLFKSDWKCLNFQYTVGETYEIPSNEEINMCVRGFHFCKNALNCLSYYGVLGGEHLAEIRAWDTITDSDKSVCRKIEIIREIVGSEREKLLTGSIPGVLSKECWYRNGLIHRDDGPAIIYHNGGEVWYQNGQIHREEGPAYTDPQHGRFWFRHDRLCKSECKSKLF
jgi:hypothetical protein